MSAWAYFKNTPPNPKFIAHHGVKGQKWGVRKQVPISGRTRASVRPSPDKRKAIAIAAVSTLAAASVVAAGVGVAKNPEAVGRALTSIGGAFAKAPKQKILSATSKSLGKANAKASAKFMKKELRKQSIKAIPGKVKSGATKVGKGVKTVAGNTARGVWGGLKEGAKEFANEKNIKQTVKSSVLRGANTALGALICGSIGLGVKTGISGRAPSRQEVTSYLTTNPNKKKK